MYKLKFKKRVKEYTIEGEITGSFSVSFLGHGCDVFGFGLYYPVKCLTEPF